MRKLLLVFLLWLPLAACSQKAPATPTQSATSNQPQRTAIADRPLYYEREITNADLVDRSLRELSLMRNTIYARAGHKFRKKWLNDYFSAQPWYHPLEKTDESKITPLDRKNAEIIAKWDAAMGDDEMLFNRKTILSRAEITPEDRIELRLISMRTGTWAGSSNDNRTPLEDPTLLDKQLTVDQLKDFSRRDLRLLRNMIYARRGRPFRSDLIKQYFQAVEWYKSDPKYTDARLTDLDKRNINLILSVENELGGPLTDWQHKKEDGWFEQA